jgi:hypothetical protein
MNADQLIESYVADVVAHLPRRQRTDVAAELRELLREELGDRTTEAEAMALLTSFGRPADVAARYRPTFTIIDPADSRTFLKASAIGIGLIWIVGLVNAFQPRPASILDGLMVLQGFLSTVGVQSLIWPGFLVTWFRPSTAAWKPRPAERDTVNRFGLASALVFWAAGTVVLINPAGALNLIAGGRLSEPARAAFAYDEEFLRLRGPAVLVVIVAQLTLLLAVVIRGRWEQLTRRVYLVLNVVSFGVFVWVLVGGNTFRQSTTDQFVKAALLVTVIGMVVDLVLRIRRQRQRMTATALPRLS